MQVQNIYLKYLKESHLYLGLFAILFFYISTFFGTITVLKPYLNSWESPSKHITLIDKEKIDLDSSINAGLNQLGNPTNKIKITLPSSLKTSISMKFGHSEKIYIDPNTNKILDSSKEENLLSDFFNQMHISVNMSRPGQILMGLASISIIFLTISGIYLWLLNRKKRSKEKSFWFRWHKDISLIMLPYIIVFALSGAVLGVMLLASSPFAYSATDGKETIMGKLVRPAVFTRAVKIRASGEKAQMLEFSKLHEKAKSNYSNLHIKEISLYNWKDKNSRIVFSGYLKDNSILTARVNRAHLVLNGETGEIVRKIGLENTHGGAQFLSAFYFFHFITDEGAIFRAIYVILGIAFAISLVFGAFIWIERKLSKLKEQKKFFHIIPKITTAFTIGIIPATTFSLFLYWALDFNMDNRNTWIIGGFYTMWSFTFLYSVYKKDALDATKLFMYLNAIFLILAVLLHGNATNMYIWNSFSNSIWDIFAMDLFFLICGVLSFLFAKNMDRLNFLNRFRGY